MAQCLRARDVRADVVALNLRVARVGAPNLDPVPGTSRDDIPVRQVGATDADMRRVVDENPVIDIRDRQGSRDIGADEIPDHGNLIDDIGAMDADASVVT